MRPHGKRIWDILLDMKQTRNIASVVWPRVNRYKVTTCVTKNIVIKWLDVKKQKGIFSQLVRENDNTRRLARLFQVSIRFLTFVYGKGQPKIDSRHLKVLVSTIGIIYYCFHCWKHIFGFPYLVTVLLKGALVYLLVDYDQYVHWGWSRPGE